MSNAYKKLIILADHLDKAGFIKEANEIDTIIKNAMGKKEWSRYENAYHSMAGDVIYRWANELQKPFTSLEEAELKRTELLADLTYIENEARKMRLELGIDKE
jgi:hypothetical protein